MKFHNTGSAEDELHKIVKWSWSNTDLGCVRSFTVNCNVFHQFKAVSVVLYV